MPEADRKAFAAKCPVIATIEGHALSPVNTCLIAMQSPGATIVGGFRQWLKAGRVVRKGEHGLSLWIPKTPKKDDAAQPGESSSSDEIHFLMGTVFDVSQTEVFTGKPVAPVPADQAASDFQPSHFQG
jgi:antirestriction protein ArdC